jgi:ribonuclease D
LGNQTAVKHWIDAPDALAVRLAAWKGQPLVAMDTEFIRERTYYPQLALVQLAIPGEILLVDPTAPGVAAVLAPFLDDPGSTKLMHSASEDLQALLRGCGVVPSPVFDTQVAAAMAGLGAGLSYLKLVEQITGITLEKGETRSDWLRRPLSDSQLKYAADDVLHLHALHAVLESKLRQLGRLAWLAADSERAIANARNDIDDPYPHLTVRSAQTLDADGQARLRRLLRWRDAEARRSDRPKSWVLDNELAVQLSRRAFEDFHRFNDVLEGNPKAPRKARRELWELLQAPLSEEESTLPLNRSGDVLDKQRLKNLQEAVAKLALSLELPDGLLCARKHLELLLEGRGWPPALEGWRRALLEPVLTPLLATSAALG